VADALFDEALAEAAGSLGAALGARRLEPAAEAAARDVLAGVAERADRRRMQAGLPSLGFDGREGLAQRVFDELFGLGATIQPLADDPTTADIVITGPADGHVNRTGVWSNFDPGFARPEALEEWARRFAERHGHHVDHASPEVDFAIARPRGRFHVVIPPVAGECAQVSIRCLRLVGKDLDALVGLGTLSDDAAACLLAAVAAKVNILVSGGGSSGKTTLANALGRAIPAHERVVTIEDLAELALADHLPRCSALYTHRPNIEGRGGRSIEELIPMALRMCADRIVVGEVRASREAVQVLDVMNTGHEGSITTIHANSAADALDRLVTLVGNAGWSYEFAVRRVAQTVAFVIHMRKLADGRRVVETITEVDGAERRGVIRASDIFAVVDGELAYRNRPREDRYLRLLESGWEAPHATAIGVGQWR
jgi:pilus assembly protein CpaF